MSEQEKEQPQILYVDDDQNNLSIFEITMETEGWVVHSFDNPMQALKELQKIQPWVVISDQRMPGGMSGVDFLEVVGQQLPDAIRLITTGYSDENLIIETIRKAHVTDYILKPWDEDDLPHRIEKAINLYRDRSEKKRLEQELKERRKELEQQNRELQDAKRDLEILVAKEEKLVKELSSWVPPVVLWATENSIEFPITRDLSLLAVDIIKSSEIHGKLIGNLTLRQKILVEFSMLVEKHGGFVENTEGDAAYASFGLMNTVTNPCEASLAVAHEFRASMHSLNNHYMAGLECGIALHYAQGVQAILHEYSVTAPNGMILRKRFDTESPHVDLVHRIEKFTHDLPGSNIVMTDTFLKQLSNKPAQSIDLGAHQFKGQEQPARLHIIKSNFVDQGLIDELKSKAISENEEGQKAA